MSEYRCNGKNGGEVIDDDTRRSYNLYKRPRLQRERDIQAVSDIVTSDGPGEVASRRTASRGASYKP